MKVRIPPIAMALATAVFGACGEPGVLGRCLEQALLPHDQTAGAPELLLCPVRDSYATDGPLEVVVVLRGSNTPVSVLNHPEYYKFTVLDAAGDRVQIEPVISATVHYGERAKLTLPASGALTFSIDLRCMRPMLAPPDSMFPACWSRYSLPEGVYRVSLRREVVKIPGLETGSDDDTMAIVSNEVSVRVR